MKPNTNYFYRLRIVLLLKGQKSVHLQCFFFFIEIVIHVLSNCIEMACLAFFKNPIYSRVD